MKKQKITIKRVNVADVIKNKKRPLNIEAIERAAKKLEQALKKEPSEERDFYGAFCTS